MKWIFAFFFVALSTSAVAMQDIANNSEGFISSFALSPDGKTVAYAKGSQVFVMRPDGSGVQTISGITTVAYTGIFRINFSPDSRYLVFDVISVNQNQIMRDNYWLADMQTLKASPVVTDISNIMDPAAYVFTADSKYFIYPQHNGSNWVLMRYNLAEGRSDQLINLIFNNDNFYVKPIGDVNAKVILVGLPQSPFHHPGYVDYSLLNWETGQNQKLNLPYMTNRQVNILGRSADTSRIFYVQCAGGSQSFYAYDVKLNTSAVLQSAPGCTLDWSALTSLPPEPEVGVTDSYLFFNNYLNQQNSAVAGFYGLNLNTKVVTKISTLNAENVKLSNDQSKVYYSLAPAGDLTEFNYDLFFTPLNGQKTVQYATPANLSLSLSIGYLMNPQETATFFVRVATGGPSSSPFIRADFWKVFTDNRTSSQILGQLEGHLVPNRDATKACAMDPAGGYAICNTMDRRNVGHLYKFAL